MKWWLVISGLILSLVGSWISTDSYIPPFYPSAYDMGMGLIAMFAGLVIVVYGLLATKKSPA